MKSHLSPVSIMALIGLLITPTMGHAGGKCSEHFAPSPRAALARAAEWRSQITAPSNLSREFSLTDAERERTIKKSSKLMQTDVIDDAATPVSEFIPESNSKLVWDEIPTEGYQTGKFTHFNVNKLSEVRDVTLPNGQVVQAGIFRGTLLTSASGHVGEDLARQFSKSDMIEIDIERAGRSTSLIKTKSRDIVTPIELEIPLIKDQEVRILIGRRGANGHYAHPMGFPEQRIIYFKWDGSVAP